MRIAFAFILFIASLSVQAQTTIDFSSYTTRSTSSEFLGFITGYEGWIESTRTTAVVDSAGYRFTVTYTGTEGGSNSVVGEWGVDTGVSMSVLYTWPSTTSTGGLGDYEIVACAHCGSTITMENLSGSAFAIRSIGEWGYSGVFEGILPDGGDADLSVPIGTGDWLQLISFSYSSDVEYGSLKIGGIEVEEVLVPPPGQGTWETTLEPRDLDNDGVIDAYYDTQLDISWLADANYVQTSGVNAGGNQTVPLAEGFIDSLNDLGHLGVNNWRLPQRSGDLTCTYRNSSADCGYNADPATGELAHLFYTTLGNISTQDAAGDPQSGGGLTNTGPFSNMAAGKYWYGTPRNADRTYFFDFSDGKQFHQTNDKWFKVMAVTDGDLPVCVDSSALSTFDTALISAVECDDGGCHP